MIRDVYNMYVCGLWRERGGGEWPSVVARAQGRGGVLIGVGGLVYMQDIAKGNELTYLAAEITIHAHKQIGQLV